MSTAIQLHRPLTPQTTEEAWAVSERFAKASICAEAFRGKPADAYMAICYGSELGLAPATALASIAVIKGKPALYAATMHGIILSSPVCKYFVCVKADKKSATYETQRHGSPAPVSKTFSHEDAKAAGLLGGMYSKYPQRMLEARAKSALARDVYPDLLRGLRAYEEIVDDVIDVPSEEFSASPVAAPAPAPGEDDDDGILEAIRLSASFADLEALLPRLRLIDKSDALYARATEEYLAKAAGFEAPQ